MTGLNGAAVMGALVIASLAIVVACQSSSDQISGPIPSSHRPSSLPRPRPTHQRVPPPSAVGLPRCEHDQLHASYAGSDGIGGGAGLVYVTVTNVGRSPCYLRGAPRFVAFDTQGMLIQPTVRPSVLTPQGSGRKFALLPREASRLFSSIDSDFTTTDMGRQGVPCSHPRVVGRLYLRLASVGKLPVQLHPRDGDLQPIATCRGVLDPRPLQRE